MTKKKKPTILQRVAKIEQVLSQLIVIMNHKGMFENDKSNGHEQNITVSPVETKGQEEPAVLCGDRGDSELLTDKSN